MFPLTLALPRRVPPAVRLKLHVACARAWEALTDTYHQQAVLFVRRLADRLPLEDALHRYFREVGVPAAMQGTVRARALLSLADSVPAIPPADAHSDPWERLRPDRLVESVRRRARFVEETTLHSRMAACLADAAVTATHSRMAVEVAECLAGVMAGDEAVMTYVRTFDLAARDSDIVFRAAMAELADRRLQLHHPPQLRVEPAAPAEPARVPQTRVAGPLAPPAFGLRIIS
jgi:hypothetical protein